MSSIGRGVARIRRTRPAAHFISGSGREASARRVLAEAGFSPIPFALESVRLDEPPPVSAARWLIDLVGMSATETGMAIDWVGAFLIGQQLVLCCDRHQIDLLGPMLDTGATLVCEPAAGGLEAAVRRGLRAPLRGMGVLLTAGPTPSGAADRGEGDRSAGEAETGAACWLDLFSDLLTHLAISRRSAGPEADAVSDLIGQTIDALLAIPDGDALRVAIADLERRGDEAMTEVSVLRAELASRPRTRSLQ